MDKDAFMSEHSSKEIGCDAIPCNIDYDFSDPKRFKKVTFPKQIGIRADSLLQLIPSVTNTANFNQTYILRFPEGVEGSLMTLHQGGMASTIIGTNGKIAGTASLYEIEQSPLFQSFTLISFATGQYFLSAITSELSEINKKLDSILNFLETEKYTDLLSEVSFIQRAITSYGSIMLHESQRVATLTNVQRSRTRAIADINFYLNQLKSVADSQDTVAVPIAVFPTRNRLNLACQLYAVSIIMEAYYSQNFDQAYLNSVLDESEQILTIVQKRELNYLTTLATRIQDSKSKFRRVELSKMQQQILALTSELTEQPNHPMLAVIKDTLSKPSKQTDLYLLPNGDIYQKID